MVLIFHNLKEVFFSLRFTALETVGFLFETADEAAAHQSAFRYLQSKSQL